MLKIRLTRLGAKKAPFYRIVVADARAPREGRPVDTIGQYDATKQPAIVNVDEEKALAWLLTFIFYAKLALWICTLLCILGCCDCLRVFLWF